MSLRWCRANCGQCGLPVWAESTGAAPPAPAAPPPARPPAWPSPPPPPPKRSAGDRASPAGQRGRPLGEDARTACRRCRLGLGPPEPWGLPLSRLEVHSLQSRELTPEDYETLLRLDEAVEPRREQTLDAAQCDACLLPVAPTAGELGEDACAICLDELGGEEACRLARCGHVFHRSCIRQWLTGKRGTCPLDGLSVLGEPAQAASGLARASAGEGRSAGATAAAAWRLRPSVGTWLQVRDCSRTAGSPQW